MDCNNVNFNLKGIWCPLNSLIYNIAMDADNSWDGVSERLKLQLAWMTIALCYSFLQCKI